LAVVPDLSHIAVHRNPAGDALKFLHVAHKFNYSAAGLSSIASQAGYVAREVTAPPRGETLEDARDLAEMWMELVVSDAKAPSIPASAGRDMLNYLLATEKAFAAGQCPAQIAIAQRAAAQPRPPQSPAGLANLPVPKKPMPKKWYENVPLLGMARRYWKKSPHQRAAKASTSRP
jgi:hypothetical protein